MMNRLLFLCAVTTWTFSSQDHHVGAFNFVQRQGDITRPLSINGRGQHAVFQISSSDFAEVDNQPQSKGTEESKSAETASIEDDVRSMRAKEIKSELHRLNISTVDAFEKEELVKRLVKARRMNDNNIHNNNAARQTSSSADASKSTEDKDTRSTWTSPSSSDKNTLVSPLYFTTVDAGRKTAGLQIQQGDKPYATIQINVLQSNSGSVDQSFPLQVLLDTACSGFVLRPSVIEQHNLPKLSTPVTMTGAGGTVGATGLTQIDTFTIETIASSSSSSSSLPTSGSSNADVPKNNVQTFGPMPAAVQDIGGLPNALDGIIGLSFLSQFSCVEMDFAQESVSFFGAGKEPPSQSKQRLLGRSTMNYISTLGLYSVDVYLGDKGPVKMLVDSGASSTFLNWKGVSDLGLSRDDKVVQRQSSAFGAMGSDNVAMELTHRITVGSSLKIGTNGIKSEPGVSLTDDNRNLRIEIGDISILEQLRNENIGGILGIDALMRCSIVRFRFGSPTNELELYE